jgi:uncharacterized membrane protein
VNLEKLNYADLLIRFRQLMPIQQAVIAGLAVLVVYVPYSYFLLNLSLMESIKMSIYSTIIFVVVFYFTAVIIMRKNKQLINQSMGPKKGLRNK